MNAVWSGIPLHDLSLGGLALIICVAGAWLSIRLLRQAQVAHAGARLSWLLLQAEATGTTIWVAHVIGVIAFHPGELLSRNLAMAVLSLLVTIAGCFAAAVVAISGGTRLTWAAGGAVLGATAVVTRILQLAGLDPAMLEPAGGLRWDIALGRVGLGMLLGGFAFSVMGRVRERPGRSTRLALLFAAATVLFLMSASGLPPGGSQGPHYPEVVHDELVLILAVAAMGLLVLGTGMASYALDSSVRRGAAHDVRLASERDALTGLGNRQWFRRQATAMLAEAEDVRTYALVLIEIAGIKQINNSGGMEMGDAVLRIVAARAKRRFAPEDVLARLGGNEFAVLMRCTDPETVEERVQNLVEVVNQAISIDGTVHKVSARCGIARFPEHGDGLDGLLNDAGLALGRARAFPGASVCQFRSETDEAERYRLLLGREMHDALAEGQFTLFYQVQRTIADGGVAGYEALLRWQHPLRGLVPPSDFIPVAESTGLIIPLGAWVIEAACREAAAWPSGARVAVNVSVVQFLDSNLPRTIAQALERTGLPPDRLEVEITESVLMNDVEDTLRLLAAIKALGVSIALDDFGTGYSSLGALGLFRFDRIKLDRSFVSRAETSVEAKAIVRAVLQIGRSMGAQVLAEGIETEDQLAFLRAEGCPEGQGYLFGRPTAFPRSEPASPPAMRGATASGDRRRLAG